MTTVPDYETEPVSMLSMAGDLLDRALTVFDAASAHPLMLDKGDTVLLSMPGRINPGQAQRLAADFKQRFGVKAVLLDGDAKPVGVQKAQPLPDLAALAAEVAEIKRTLAPIAALCSKAEPLLSAVTRKD